MILAIDVDYRDNNTAKAAGIVFENWTDEFPKATITTIISPIADYEPGQFYKRELPCILALLDKMTDK